MYVVDEPHVEHRVGLVQDDVRDAAEVDRAALYVVYEPAGRGHDDLDAPLERVQLHLHALPAVYGGGPHVGVLCKLAYLVGDLDGQLPRGRDDQPLDVAAGLYVLQHRYRVGRRLARASVRLADDVPAGEQYRDGRLLYGERLGEAHVPYGV